MAGMSFDTSNVGKPYAGNTATNDYDKIAGPGRLSLGDINGSVQNLLNNNASEKDALKANTLSENVLLPGQRGLDDTTSGLLGEQAQRASADPVAEGLAGISDYGLNPKASDINASANSLGMATPADLGTALERRGSQNFNNTFNSIKRGLEFNAPMVQAARENSASAGFNRAEQVKLKNYQQQVQYQNQQRQLWQAYNNAQEEGRKSAIGAIIGGVGAVVGGAAGFMVGGPAGAAVGAGVGMGAGKAVGGAAGAN